MTEQDVEQQMAEAVIDGLSEKPWFITCRCMNLIPYDRQTKEFYCAECDCSWFQKDDSFWITRSNER